MRRQSIKAFLTWILILTLLIGAMPALAGYVAPEMTTVTIALYAGAEEMAAFDDVLGIINANLVPKNIQAQVQQVPADGWVQYYQKVMAQQAAGTAPDIGRIAEFYLPLTSYKNQVVDLTERLPELDANLYFENAFQGASVQGGRTFGLPSGMYSVVMYFNKDLFDAAGLPYPSQDWANPTSMAEVADLAQALTSGAGAKKVYGFGCHTSILHANHFLKGNGGIGVYDAEGKAMLSKDPQNLDIYKLYERMCVTDKSMVTTSDTEVITTADLFREGRLAMYVDGTWNQANIKSATKFVPGIAAVPGKSGMGVSTSFLDQWVMFSGSKNQDAAWEVLKQIVSEPSLAVISRNSLYGVTISKKVLDETIESLVGEVFDDKDIETYLGSLDVMQAPPYTMAYSEFNPKYVSVLSQLMLGNLTAEQAAQDMDSLIDKANELEY